MIDAASTPAAASLARFGVMTTTWSRTPVTVASRTPSTPWIFGSTVVTTLSAIASWSPPSPTASTTTGKSSVLPAMTCGLTPAGNWGAIRLSALCILDHGGVDVGAEVELHLHEGGALTGGGGHLLRPGDALHAFSIGWVTCCSTISGEAPR